MRTHVVFASLVLIAAGCGGSGQPAPASSTSSGTSAPASPPASSSSPASPAAPGAPPAPGANQMAQGLQQFAQGLSQLSQSQAKPVDYELLKGLLPEMNGWTKSRARGEQMTKPFAISNAKAHYSAGESSMDIEITDSAMNQMIFAPFAMFMASGYEERSDDGYKKSGTISGSPGFESWDKKTNRGEVTVIVANRFVVQATGRRVGAIEPVRKAIEAIDLARLATLK
jgi:hypothetical protein